MHAELLGASPALPYASSLFSAAGVTASPETIQAAVLMAVNKAAAVRAYDDVFAIAALIVIAGGLIPALFLSATPAKRKTAPTSE